MKYLTLIAALLIPVAALGEAKDAASRERARILVDTNATTTATAYTPGGAGQILSGKVGGTNAVWIATSTSTNSWVKIAQQ